jgi:hypothetical protein
MSEAPTEAAYIAECFWPNVREEEVEQGAACAQRAAAELTSEGRRVTFAGSILMPEDEVVFYLFDGDSPDDVHEACARAGLPLERVVESIRR